MKSRLFILSESVSHMIESVSHIKNIIAEATTITISQFTFYATRYLHYSNAFNELYNFSYTDAFYMYEIMMIDNCTNVDVLKSRNENLITFHIETH